MYYLGAASGEAASTKRSRKEVDNDHASAKKRRCSQEQTPASSSRANYQMKLTSEGKCVLTPKGISEKKGKKGDGQLLTIRAYVSIPYNIQYVYKVNQQKSYL